MRRVYTVYEKSSQFEGFSHSRKNHRYHNKDSQIEYD